MCVMGESGVLLFVFLSAGERLYKKGSGLVSNSSNNQYLSWCKYIVSGRGLIGSVLWGIFCLISRRRLLNYYDFCLTEYHCMSLILGIK